MGAQDAEEEIRSERSHILKNKALVDGNYYKLQKKGKTIALWLKGASWALVLGIRFFFFILFSSAVLRMGGTKVEKREGKLNQGVEIKKIVFL